MLSFEKGWLKRQLSEVKEASKMCASLKNDMPIPYHMYLSNPQAVKENKQPLDSTARQDSQQKL